MTPYVFEGKKVTDGKEKRKASTFRMEVKSTPKDAKCDSDTPINLTVSCSSFSHNTVFELKKKKKRDNIDTHAHTQTSYVGIIYVWNAEEHNFPVLLQFR